MLRAELACAWCGKLFLRHPRDPLRSYCSAQCARAHQSAGYGPSKPVRDARRANRPPNPKGCTTVEEFLAKGGQITRCPAAMPEDFGGVPVRSSRFRGDGPVRHAR